MITSVMQGVAAAIRAEFGDGYKIYIDSVEQGFQTPCFFIALVQRLDTSNLRGRYTVSVSLDVKYFPSDTRDLEEELFGVSERLENVLEYITLPGGVMLRGKERHCNTDDGELNFYVIYETGIYSGLPADVLMEAVQVNGGVKGGE